MKGNTAAVYAERFDRVFAHIDEHLSEELSVERLSRVAHFSKYHFHRQFSQFAGISVARYIQLMRLRRASYRLAFESETSILDIALEAGFENPESFSRAFKKAFGQTPSRFRRAADWRPWTETYRLPRRERRHHMDVTVIDFPDTRVAVLEHRGDPALINASAQRFIEWRKSTGFSPIAYAENLGIAYDDPATTPAERFRFDLCGSVTTPVPDNDHGVVNKVIPGGRCAMVRHHGSHDRIADAAYYLYREWLPESGEELRDFPLFFHYRNLMPETPEHELVTDVCLPLV
ncbi:AraC family transcriptional regulator [Halomonas maura]|uniref:AraC family transcriptional regulator n=1 Tax=Halomonas maura TaxID=117606 RepID=UPI0025B582EA|nr:AraC family transcriptional regulator [Halomonas maura]MDN3556931.1 AraC family transcriptional regulator [Halomonas maura]